MLVKETFFCIQIYWLDMMSKIEIKPQELEKRSLQGDKKDKLHKKSRSLEKKIT